jgi:hypothetical protein
MNLGGRLARLEADAARRCPPADTGARERLARRLGELAERLGPRAAGDGPPMSAEEVAAMIRERMAEARERQRAAAC